MMFSLERLSVNRHVPAGLAVPGCRHADVRCLAAKGRFSNSVGKNAFENLKSGTAKIFAPSRQQLPDQDREPGEVVLGRYTIIRKMGEGANGVTYRAKDKRDGSLVAVKELAIGRLKNWKQYDLFKREADTLRSLNHPNIPKYKTYREVKGCYFLVQELADGPTLGEVIRARRRFNEADVKHVARELLKTLDYMSSRRPAVVHRDIKPENIVLEGGKIGGRVLLVDFGGVQDALTQDSNSFGTTVIGTAGYMPPEQMNGQATVASDMYSLGCVLLFMLSGRTPAQFRSQRLRLSFEKEVPMAENMRMLLRSMLEPIAEDRCSVKQALDVLDGKIPEMPGAGAPGAWIGKEQVMLGMSLNDDGSLDIPASEIPSEKPIGCRIDVMVVDDQLFVEIPSDGFKASSSFTFAAVWNGAVALWTVGAATSHNTISAVTSVPFWVVGGGLALEVAMSAMRKESLRMDLNGWTMKSEVTPFSGSGQRLGRVLKADNGRSSDLTGAVVVTTMLEDGDPSTAIELQGRHDSKPFRFGAKLGFQEQLWLVGQINRHVSRMHELRQDYDRLYYENS